jgi:phosphoadenosine phosphosulfate reductase
MKQEEALASLPRWREELAQATPQEVLAWARHTFGARLGFATSFGLEDQVLTDVLAQSEPRPGIFTLDTGRLFPETYDLLAETERRYALKIRVYFPDPAEVEEMVQEHGVNLFRRSVELRKRCCRVRKVGPLRRALVGLDAWITGMRREQSVTRNELETVAWDEINGLVKIAPLSRWSASDLEAYLRAHEVPVHPLHAKGYPSIGCACCTRAVAPDEDARAGRWWWELPEQKECGLHCRVRSRPTPAAARG